MCVCKIKHARGGVYVRLSSSNPAHVCRSAASCAGCRYRYPDETSPWDEAGLPADTGSPGDTCLALPKLNLQVTRRYAPPHDAPMRHIARRRRLVLAPLSTSVLSLAVPWPQFLALAYAMLCYAVLC